MQEYTAQTFHVHIMRQFSNFCSIQLTIKPASGYKGVQAIAWGIYINYLLTMFCILSQEVMEITHVVHA